MNDEKIFDKIDKFHQERIDEISSGKTKENFRYEGGKIVLLILPYEAFSSPKDYDLSHFEDEYESIKPFRDRANSQRYDLDGLVYIVKAQNDKWLSYVRIFPNGIIEAVDAVSLRSSEEEIPYRIIEEEIILKTHLYLKFQTELGLKFSFFIYLDLLEVKGKRIQYRRKTAEFDNTHPIDRENLNLPRLIINDEPVDTKKIFKSSFDRIWMACGYPRCYDYNEEGEFISE